MYYICNNLKLKDMKNFSTLTLMFLAIGFAFGQRPINTELLEMRSLVTTSTVQNDRGGCAESPYDETDPIYVQVINLDSYCCDGEWDDLCQSQYDIILNGCDAEAPYDFSDADYLLTLALDDFCCDDSWDEQCESHYEHVAYGCFALSPYGPSDPIWVQVIQEDDFCCNNSWDGKCEGLYNSLASASIAEQKELAFTMYPNPANTEFELALNQASEIITKVQIFDHSGKIVFENSPNDHHAVINTTSFTVGIYHVVVATSQTVLNQKLAIIR
jgi:hypothetical protein